MSDIFNTVQLNRKQRGLGGFTLIEMLIVIVVLGMLAAIVVFAVGGITSSSAASACATDAKSVSYAIAAEQSQTPNVPPVYAVGSEPGDLVPAYLVVLPISTTV
jgi:general secretion pathway protein G